MTDSTVSLTQVLQENGWTKEEIDLLTNPAIASALLSTLRTGQAIAHSVLNSEALSRLKGVSLEELFSIERTEEQGFDLRTRNRFLEMLSRYKTRGQSGSASETRPITTIKQLVALSKADLLRQPKISEATLEYVVTMLQLKGLRLRVV